MRPPWRGLLLWGLVVGGVEAAYDCTAVGTECQHPNYAGGHFTDVPSLVAACDASVTCLSYQWNAGGNSGWMCATAVPRVDTYDEVIHCVKPSPPPMPPSVSLTLFSPPPPPPSPPPPSPPPPSPLPSPPPPSPPPPSPSP